jgi:hypothetical protein
LHRASGNHDDVEMLPKRRVSEIARLGVVLRGAQPLNPNPTPTPELPGRFLTDRAIALAVAGLSAFGVLVMVAMFGIADKAGSDKQQALQIETIKYGVGLIVGSGALAALLLSVRRQRLAEAAHRLVEEVHAHAEKDASARRVTELYAKSVEQLGSDIEIVRLGGLYALERLAQDNPSQRQVIVDVICGYLRMPPIEDEGAKKQAVAQDRLLFRAITKRKGRIVAASDTAPSEDAVVRRAAQEILTNHLRLPDERRTYKSGGDSQQSFWSDIRLNLRGAILDSWYFVDCRVRWANFSGARFLGEGWFTNSDFTSHAIFSGAEFTHGALFRSAKFGGMAKFQNTVFNGEAVFSHGAFCGGAWFKGCTLNGGYEIDGITMGEGVDRKMYSWPPEWSNAGLEGK